MIVLEEEHAAAVREHGQRPQIRPLASIGLKNPHVGS